MSERPKAGYAEESAAGEVFAPAATPMRGPIEDAVVPEQLTGRVVDPGPPLRIHGYAVDTDLARHYGFTDVVRLALVGELPDEAQGRAFDVALQLLAPIDVSFAPAHVGVLTRICAMRSSSSVGVIALALAEQARSILVEHAALLQWLDAPDTAFPEAFTATSASDVEAIERILPALHAASLSVPALAARPTRLAALLAILHACGLTRGEQIEAALVLAQLPCVLGEAFATRVGSIREYPMRLPPFRYEEAP